MSNATINIGSERLAQRFLSAGAIHVEIQGRMICTGWKSKALAIACEVLMRRVGLTDIEQGMNGPRTAYICTGWIE